MKIFLKWKKTNEHSIDYLQQGDDKMLYKKIWVIAIMTMFLLLSKHTTIAQIQTQTIDINENVNKNKYNNELEKYLNTDIRSVKLIVTAYAPFDNKSGMCNDGDPTKTATGTYPTHGTVAVNPERFPYGTKFYIPGYGYGVGEDTGGAMRKNHNKIDVFMKTYEDAIKWGIKELDVIIFED